MHAELLGLLGRRPDLAPCANDILAAHVLTRESIGRGGKLLLCGNGGSASDADHWSGELLKGFRRQRPLTEAERTGLPVSLAARLQRAIAAIPLGSFTAFGSAFGNDVAPEFTYAQLVWALGRPGNVLIGLSTSGNSGNVCAAATVAAHRGLKTIGLTGRSGGRLKELCDVCICAPADETAFIQECHLPVYHCLCMMLEEDFFGDPPE